MATSASAAGSTAFTSDGDTDAEMSTNRAPIRICTSVPWNSSISDTSILRWLARAAPISVVATKPASSRMRSAPTRAAATIMSTAGTAWRGTVRCVSCSRNHRIAAASAPTAAPTRMLSEHLPRAPQLPAGPSGEHRVEDEDAEQGADRIDEHPLPHQQRAHPWRRADERQQRQHHGRARDDEHGADEQRHEIAEVIEEQGRRGPDAGPRHQHPDGDEQADRPAYVARDLPHREAQAGLEQDQPHGQRHERLVERARAARPGGRRRWRCRPGSRRAGAPRWPAAAAARPAAASRPRARSPARDRAARRRSTCPAIVSARPRGVVIQTG